MDEVYSAGVCDAHCHPTDIMDSVERIAHMKAKVLTVMSTRSQDQDLVADAARKYPTTSRDELNGSSNTRHVIPAFGWHPWFSHQMYFDPADQKSIEEDRKIDAVEHYKSVLTPEPDEQFLATLMPPISFSTYLRETEERLKQFPLALVGEIGLDRTFRLPEGPSSITGDISQKIGGDEGSHTPGTREGRRLTPYRVNLDHQKKILKTQLELAGRLNRPVSVHSVQAHGLVLEIFQSLWKDYMRPSKREIKKRRDADGAVDEKDAKSSDTKKDKPLPYPPRICMHSYSGPREALKMFLDPKAPSDVFFSFSECINFGSPASNKALDVIEAVPGDRILIESDLHCAGDLMDQLLQDIIRRICEKKGWELEEGVEIFKRNYERFIFGE